MKYEVKIYHPDGVALIEETAQLVELADGFKFAEGPLWHPDGYLLISDIPQNKIFRLYLNGVMHVPLYNSGGMYIVHTHLSDMIGSNGLALDRENNIILCQHGSHCIARIDRLNNITNLCCSYNGKPFNSPNDVIVKSDGAIFFTDPPYGLKDQKLNPAFFQPNGGVYRYFNNKISLLSADMDYANGLCFSKDERFLFVSSNHPDEKIIYKYELSAQNQILHKEIFAFINADGIKTDPFDNLFAATAEGIVILSPRGEKLALIMLPEMATNIAFGGENNSLLFITTPSKVYYIKMNYSGNRKYYYNPFDSCEKN